VILGGVSKADRNARNRVLAVEAHTVAVDVSTHLVYCPLQRGSRGRPQLLVMKPPLAPK
jgi:hypothetical protein